LRHAPTPTLFPYTTLFRSRQVVRARQLELRRKVALLARRDVVEADLPDPDDAVLLEVARQERQDALVDAVVVGLLRVERQRAVVADAELLGAESLPPDDRVEVVHEGADRRH